MSSDNSVNLQELLEESGGILRGHFILSSGRHSDVYFEKFRILEYPPALSALCQQIADTFRGQIDLVAGPTTGGIIIAFEVARLMGTRAVYVESVDGAKTLRRGATIPPEARVLVVDDVLTTGLSVQETIDAVRAAGGSPAGVGVLIDRSAEPMNFGVPMFAAFRVDAESWAADDLPAWLAAQPAVKPGTRA